MSTGISLAGWAYVMSLFGIFGPFYLAGQPLAEWTLALRRPVTWGVVLLALLVSIITPTAPSQEAGRWGGYLWTIAQRFPTVADRSLLFVLLAPLGAMVVVLTGRDFVLEQSRPLALTWLISIMAWLCSMSANRQIFQRYYEPTVLIFLAIGISHLRPSDEGRVAAPSSRSVLLTLTGFQVLVTLATVYLP